MGVVAVEAVEDGQISTPDNKPVQIEVNATPNKRHSRHFIQMWTSPGGTPHPISPSEAKNLTHEQLATRRETSYLVSPLDGKSLVEAQVSKARNASRQSAAKRKLYHPEKVEKKAEKKVETRRNKREEIQRMEPEKHKAQKDDDAKRQQKSREKQRMEPEKHMAQKAMMQNDSKRADRRSVPPESTKHGPSRRRTPA